MHKQLLTWKFINNCLQQKKAVMLLYVADSKGSSPGRCGFCMAVDETGYVFGSIGGGIMEHKFVEMAKARLVQQQTVATVHKQLHDKKAAANQSGMICSGEQTIILYKLKQEDREAIDALIHSLEQYLNGTLQLTPTGIRFIPEIPVVDFNLQLLSGHDYLYQEKTGHKQELYIIGGGHCSLALSQLMSNMDFYVRIFDDRENLHTIGQNSFAHEITIIPDYEALGEQINSGKNKYVVIMTVGYRTDAVAIRALLDKDFAYVGLMGSKFKVKKLLRDLDEEGLSVAVKKLHSPIGIPIKSQTPEEIAVSIAAQIIQVKNKNLT